MRKRKEDNLIRLAFSERVDKEPTGAEADFLREFEAMRHDLEDARNIPEHQLSNDRLREAILRTGLKPAQAPAKSEPSWIWNASAACAVIALLGVVFVRHSQTTVAPTFNLKGMEQVAAKDIHFDEHPFRITAEPTNSLVKTVAFQTHRTHSHHHRSTHRNLEAANGPDSTLDPSLFAMDEKPQSANAPQAPTSMVDFNPMPVAMVAKATPVNNVQMKGEASKPDAGPLVEIGMGEDIQTGARAAREIESSSLIVRG